MASPIMPMPLSERKREENRRAKGLRRQFEGLQIQETSKTSISKREIPTELGVTKRGDIRGRFCKVCLQPGHLEHRCPLLHSCKLGQKLGPQYVIVCRCCYKENSHPEDPDAPRCAARMFCANCLQIGHHMTPDCTKPDRRGTRKL